MPEENRGPWSKKFETAVIGLALIGQLILIATLTPTIESKLSIQTYFTHMHPGRLMAFVPDYPGQPEYQKSKPSLDFTEARDSEWQWHPLGHMQVCTSRQTDNHASTPPLSFTGRMPFLPPNQQRQSTELGTRANVIAVRTLPQLGPGPLVRLTKIREDFWREGGWVSDRVRTLVVAEYYYAICVPE